MQNMRGCYERPQNNINIEKIKEHQMSLERTIRDTVIAESHELDGRLQQLVRAGLMPANTIPILRKAIGKVQGGMTLQGAERDVMATFINSMMFIVLGDDAIFNRARSGAKGYATEETEDDGWYTHSQIHGSMKSEKHPKGISAAEWKSGIRWHHGKNKRINIKEEVEIDENAKVAAHLIKRYGENVRQSHVRSAAGDLGVDASKLSKAVRKKLGKTMLPEAKEKTEYDYEGDMAMGQLKSIIANSQRMHDMLSDDTNLPEWVQSKITLAEDYISTASNYMQGEMSEETVNEYAALAGVAGRMIASKLAAKAGAGVATRAMAGAAGSAAASSAVNKLSSKKETKEEVEVIDELSKATMGSYVKKASGAEQPKNVMSPKNVPLTKIAAYQGDSETGHFGKRFNQGTYDKAERLRKNRETGIKRAVDKITKEEVEIEEELTRVTSGNKGYGYHGTVEARDDAEKDKRYSAMHRYAKKLVGDAGHLSDAKKPNVMVKHFLDSPHGRHIAENPTDKNITSRFSEFKKKYKPEMHEEVEEIEEKRGLWDNIHAKRKRIKSGSGERMRKPGSEGAPTAADLKASQTEEVEQVVEVSKATMGRYINKAKDSIDMASYRSGIKDGTAISSSTPYTPKNPLEKKLTKRHKGISMAVKKLTKEDIEAVKSMHESYKNTFNAALEHYNIKSPSELGEDKRKEFFNHVDQKFKKGDN